MTTKKNNPAGNPPGENLPHDHNQGHDQDRKKSENPDPHKDKEGYEVMATAEEEIPVGNASRHVESSDLGVEQEPGSGPSIQPDPGGNASNAPNAEEPNNDLKPPEEKEEEFLAISKAAQILGMTTKRLKTWLTSGHVEGGEIVKGRIKIPHKWVKQILNGEALIPHDGKDLPKALRPGLEKQNMAKKKEADMLQSLKDSYGSEATITVQVYQQVEDGGWQFAREFQSVPEPPDLAIAFPEGGTFKFRIFNNGAFTQEVKGIKIRQDPNAMGNAGMPPGASSMFDPATRRRTPFRPGMPQGGGPFNGPQRSPADEVSAHAMRKVVDKAFDGSSDTSSARIMMDGFTRMREAQEKTQQAEQARNERMLESIRAEARDEKAELKGLINEVASGQEAEANRTLEIFKEFVTTDKEREKSAAEERLASEKERTTNMLEQQKTFFESMGELDKKRQEMADKLAEKIAESNAKIFDAQLAALAEQRTNNTAMFEIQKSHLEKVQELNASSQPWVMVSETLKGIQETIAPVIQNRLGSPGASTPGAAKGEEGMGNNMIDQIKQSDFFIDEVTDILKHIAGNIPVGFKANHLLGLMAAEPQIGIVMNYVITRTIGEVLEGVKLDDNAKKIVASPEAKKWWDEFKAALISMMSPPAIEQGEPPKKVEG